MVPTHMRKADLISGRKTMHAAVATPTVAFGQAAPYVWARAAHRRSTAKCTLGIIFNFSMKQRIPIAKSAVHENTLAPLPARRGAPIQRRIVTYRRNGTSD